MAAWSGLRGKKKLGRIIIAVALAISALATVSCLSVDQGPSTEPDRESGCLRPFEVDGFVDARADSVVLTDGGRHYRATFANACTGLHFAFGVGLNTRGTCVSPGDLVEFTDNTRLPQSCLISALSYVPPVPKASN